LLPKDQIVVLLCNTDVLADTIQEMQQYSNTMNISPTCECWGFEAVWLNLQVSGMWHSVTQPVVSNASKALYLQT